MNISIFFVLKTNYFSIYEREDIDEEKHKIFILCDSHGLALNDYLEDRSVYNFSAASDSYFDIKRKLFYLINRKIEINHIIISADDHTLSFYRESFNNSDRSLFFINAFSEDDNLITSRYEYIKQKYLLKYIPILRPKTRTIVRKTIRSLFVNENEEEIHWIDIKNKEKISKIRADIQFQGDIQSTKLRDTLKEIVETCKKYNIALSAIKYPLSGDYIAAINGRTFGADIYLKSLGIEVFDFTKAYENRDSLFLNQDHLNDAGGLEFSKHISKSILDKN